MRNRQYWTLAAFIATPLLIALTAQRTESLRPQAPELRADTSVFVISARDSGGGTLREAIAAAARTPDRVRIVIRPPRIALLSPLPPIVNRNGVVIDATASRCEIDAAAIEGVPVLQITAPRTAISGLRVRHARDIAILLHAPAATLRDVSVTDSTDGVVLLNADNTTIEHCVFERNTNGIRIDGTSAGVSIRASAFRANDGAAIRAIHGTTVAGPTVRIENNTFRDDRTSIVAVNLVATIMRNQIRGAIENGIQLMLSRSVVRSNRILSGAVGILADRCGNLIIEQNEIDHNSSMGILIRACRNASVQRNLIYANAYGIASVFGDGGAPDVIAENTVMSDRIDGVILIGSSPVLRGNRILQNAGAAARVLDYIPWQASRIRSDPRFDGNTFTGNQIDGAPRGEYRAEQPKDTR